MRGGHPMKGKMRVRISYIREADGVEGMCSGSGAPFTNSMPCVWEVPLQLGSLEKGPCGRRSLSQE